MFGAVEKIFDLPVTLFQGDRDLPVRKSLEEYELQNGPVVSRKPGKRPMDEDFSLFSYVELLEILLLGYAVFHILDGRGGQPGAVPYMIDRRVPADRIQPGTKGAPARIPRLFDDQAKEGLLRQLLDEKNAAGIAV